MFCSNLACVRVAVTLVACWGFALVANGQNSPTEKAGGSKSPGAAANADAASAPLALKVKVSPAELKRDGAFGFPQASAQVLCDQPDLRVSVCSNKKYLYLQAIAWTDNDDAIGESNDGRKIGDWSDLMLDVDGDQQPTPKVDRNYALNPWPASPGLRYTVVLSERSTTGLQSNSRGRGSIQFVEGTDGKRYRVDSFAIPLDEIGKRPGETVRLAYWGSSPQPKLIFNSVGFQRAGQYYGHQLPKNKYHDVVLSDGPAFDVSALPEGREQAAALPARKVKPVPSIGSVPPEVTAADWINIDTAPSLKDLRGKVVLVEFWATWCGPCIAGIPHLNELHDTYGPKGLTILSFTDQSRRGIENFLEKTTIKYAIGTGSELAAEYGVRGIPHAFLISKDGKLLWHGTTSTEEFEKQLAAALAAP